MRKAMRALRFSNLKLSRSPRALTKRQAVDAESRASARRGRRRGSTSARLTVICIALSRIGSFGTARAKKFCTQGRPLLDKGKPVARRGRKATGQTASLIAELPKEGGDHPPGHGGLPRGRSHSCSNGGGSWVLVWPWLQFSVQRIRRAPECLTLRGPLPRRKAMGAPSRTSGPIASTTRPRPRHVLE